MNILETHVLELVGESVDSPDVFTDDSTGMAQIRDSLNDAIEEICMVTGGYKEDYILPLKKNKSFNRITSTRGEFAWITDVWLVGIKRRLEQTDLIRLNSFNPRWLQNTGTPESYFPIGTKYIGVWPKPSADNDALRITAVMVPSRYTEDTDRIKIKDDFQWAAVHLAVSEYWASRGDAKTAMYHLGKYVNKLGLQLDYPLAFERVNQFQTDKQPWPTSTG